MGSGVDTAAGANARLEAASAQGGTQPGAEGAPAVPPLGLTFVDEHRNHRPMGRSSITALSHGGWGKAADSWLVTVAAVAPGSQAAALGVQEGSEVRDLLTLTLTLALTLIRGA